jgi:hypothetical protein
MTESYEPTPLYNAVTAALDENETRYTELENATVGIRLAGKRGTYDVFISVHEDLEQIVCYCSLSFRAPEERRLDLSEAITRANWGFRLGCFELDFSDGEVRFRSGIDVEGGLFGATMLHNMIMLAMGSCERYQEAFLRVIYGNVPPQVAVQEADAKWKDGFAPPEPDEPDY